MSLAVVKNDIDNNQIPAVYLWYGEDRYSLTKALKLLKDFFQLEDPSGSGIEVFIGKDVAVENIIEAANTSSFFSRRLVVVDDISYFNQSKGKTQSENEDEKEADNPAAISEREDTDCILQYLENPNPATCLVLISEKANKGRKLYKEIAKTGKVLEFSYPKGQDEWLRWIQNEAKAKGKKINTSAASFLLDWAGHHTGILSTELDKLVLFTGDKPEIDRPDIQMISVPLIETKVFALLDAIAAGKTADALSKLKEVLSQEYHLKVFAMIVRQVRLLLAGSLIRKKSGTVQKFMDITGIRSAYEGNKIFRQAAAFSPQKLSAALEDCLQTELAMKSSGGNPHLLLEIMIIRFCTK